MGDYFGAASTIFSRCPKLTLKSGISASMVVPGFIFLYTGNGICSNTGATIFQVITGDRSNTRNDAASLILPTALPAQVQPHQPAGFAGRFTAQNLQERVQIFPSIIKWRYQPASIRLYSDSCHFQQMVCRPCCSHIFWPVDNFLPMAIWL